MLATPDAGQIASSSQYAPKRFSNSEERYRPRNERPSFDYQRPYSGYEEAPTEAPPVRRRVDPTLEAVRVIKATSLKIFKALIDIIWP